MWALAPLLLYPLAIAWAFALPIGCGDARSTAWLALGLAAMAPFVRRATAILRPPRLPWLAAPLAHLPVALLLSIGAAAITIAGYAVAGSGCEPSALLLPAVRRALIFYALAALGWTLLARRCQA